MDAAKVVGHLSPMGDILPASERQARPLTRLEPAQQHEAWQEAAVGGWWWVVDMTSGTGTGTASGWGGLTH